MNGLPPSFDWNHARAFLATAQSGSLSAAARLLGLTQPTLSRQVAALETELGLTLFERVGRGLEITEAGREMLVHFAAMGEASEKATLAASGQSQSVEGRVSLSVSDIIAAYIMPEALVRLRQHAPGIEIELLAVNGISNLQKREADIALRHIRPREPELIARSLGDASGRLYGATPYLAHLGALRSLKDLNAARFISTGDPEEFLTYLNARGYCLTRANVAYSSPSGIAGWEMVKQGLGLGVMMSDLGDHAEGVVPVLPDFTTVYFPNWLTTHRELHTSKRIRIVFDFLADYFKETFTLK
ncbi:LysR family transcriptional regulator [Neptunicoccus cionae]|uniref:LysR family transcriptional regulator n=1 Tax=Neptunicoccus cionae TaxID=2035344 RepID=A0A916R3M9_9RHOB|nr:LysR family transcriptional regulator [Amylibacter cionae]GGA31498.1 LysR family transcriptional regulator [Amylibacter cionae]